MVNRLWGRESDHYYRLTAELAARGAQQATWRLMAFISFGFGIASTVWAFSPVAAHTLWHLILALFVGLACFAMGVQWLRQRWPNRTVSKTCALVGGLCLGMANAVVSDPVVGLLGNAAFVVLTIYVALFHALHNLAVLWLFAGVAEAVLGVRLAPYDPTLAATAALSFVFSNVFAAAVCRVLLRLTRTDVPGDHLEPLTGFLTRDGFREQLATMLRPQSAGRPIRRRGRHQHRQLLVAEQHARCGVRQPGSDQRRTPTTRDTAPRDLGGLPRRRGVLRRRPVHLRGPHTIELAPQARGERRDRRRHGEYRGGHLTARSDRLGRRRRRRAAAAATSAMYEARASAGTRPTSRSTRTGGAHRPLEARAQRTRRRSLPLEAQV